MLLAYQYCTYVHSTQCTHCTQCTKCTPYAISISVLLCEMHSLYKMYSMYTLNAISISVTQTNSFIYRDHALCIGTMDQLREQNQHAPFKMENLVLNEYRGGKKTDVLTVHNVGRTEQAVRSRRSSAACKTQPGYAG